MIKVSCICPTYNRPPDYQWLLEEAIEAFLRQDYPEKELLVINDCPGQELVCDAPGVVVINFPRRFSSWGEKLNAGIALAQGSLIAPWDDDDIMLPWRLSKSLERLADADYYNPHAYWFLNARSLQSDQAGGVGQNGSLFTRSAFDVVNGYPHVSGGGDLLLDQRLKHHPEVKQASPSALALHEWFYIYRWDVSPLHLSGKKPYSERYKQIGLMPIEQGLHFLSPHWREDYVQTTRYALGMSPYEV
jgi:glycosyltransferase involved in cell wall biosynthesis